MAVSLDAAVESHTGTSGSQSEASFTWNHTGGGSPKGLLVFTLNDDNIENEITSVTYDGTNVPAVAGSYTEIGSGETAGIKAWFLGSGIPSGTKAVVVNRVNNTSTMYAVSFTVNADADTEVHTDGMQTVSQSSGTLAEVNVTDGSPGTDSLRLAFLYTGLTSPPSVGANSTGVGGGIDLGQYGAIAAYETTPGQGSRPVGFSTASPDEVVAIYLAIKQSAPAASPLLAWISA